MKSRNFPPSPYVINPLFTFSYNGPSDTTSSIDKSSRAPPGMKQAEPSQAAR